MAVNPLYERIAGVHATRPKISVDAFLSVLSEWAYGKMTGTAANDAIGQMSQADSGPVPLDATETTQAITAFPISGGSAAANADGKASRALKVHEVRACLLMLEFGNSPDPSGTGFNTVISGYAPANMSGVTVNGTAGGKLNVPRRDS